MTADESFKTRLRQAHKAVELQLGRDYGQDEIGKDLGQLRGSTSVPQGTVSRWFRGTVPALETIVGLATVLGVDPGWLAFGEHCGAQAPSWFTPRAAELPAQTARRQLPVAQRAGKKPRRHSA